jgi:transcriptional regulator GlxA family with amidase domain
LSVETKRLDLRLKGRGRYDTVLITGGLEPSDPPKEVVEFARKSMGRARRVASICMGAFALAEAGVLDGREVTTHWGAAAALQARYPKLKVNSDRIYIVDGSIWTSAGASAGIDLALGMVERDLGQEVARLVARKLVLYHRRAGGQSQHSALLELDAKSDRIQLALDFAKRHLAKDLDVEQLAEAARLSPRQFSRVFRAETGQSPAKAVEALRVEAARVMMEQTNHPIEVIATQSGFGDRERMRRSFVRAFGKPPQAIRRAAHAA